jgi:hypothetical protein
VVLSAPLRLAYFRLTQLLFFGGLKGYSVGPNVRKANSHAIFLADEWESNF